MSQWVFIEASDVWLFRDNKPFSAQQNFVARGQFPPLPMTMQGVVRTHYLERELQREGHTWEDYRQGNVNAALKGMVGLPPYGERKEALQGSLRVTGPFVARMNGNKPELLIRAPLDLLCHEDTKNLQYRLLAPPPTQVREFATDLPFASWQPLSGGGERYKDAKGWLTEAQFRQYLRKDVNGLGKLLADDEVYQIEDRVGLALDYGRRAHVEGMFYRAEFVRPCEEIGLLAHVSEDVFETDTGYLNLGGESRSGHYRVVDVPNSLPQSGHGKVKIVLLTPAYFSGGWQPEGKDWSTWVGEGSLVSVAMGKPQLISGWDLANNQPKPLHHYVPAGSVFFFENADVTGKSFTEKDDHAAIGFGAFAVGSW